MAEAAGAADLARARLARRPPLWCFRSRGPGGATATTADLAEIHRRNTGHYDERRVIRILRDLPNDHDALAAVQHLRDKPKRHKGAHAPWIEEQAAERADVKRALAQLGELTRRVVIRSYVVGDTDRHIATILGCHRRTVAELRKAGPVRLADILCGRWR